ncbi:MAG: hypothetical protein KIT72_17040 [Polyangiaceae bacterium]|nr:hypothetical protein [Polyangiaceae bacterium]MCW5792126.1 hypothetical protein [Polyangiaceae bacterium]
MALTPLTCHACGGHAAVVRAAQTTCRYCGAAVPIPPEYLAAAQQLEQHEALRRAVEPKWRRLAKPTSSTLDWVAVAASFCLPPLASAVVAWFADPTPTPLVGVTLVTIPAIIPGALLSVWTFGSRATGLNLAAQLVAGPPERPGGDPSCRGCGAPLPASPGALAATCLYCRTDSLLTGSAARDASWQVSSRSRTLREALSVWRIRVLLLVMGSAGTAGLLLLLAGVLLVTYALSG